MVGLSKTIIFAAFVMIGCALAIPNLGDAQIQSFNNLGLPELNSELQQEQIREKREVCCNVNGEEKEAKAAPGENQAVLEEHHLAQRLARHLPFRGMNYHQGVDPIKMQGPSEPTDISA